jgi:hypothetical protein
MYVYYLKEVVDKTKEEQVKSIKPQNEDRMEMEKPTDSKRCITFARRDGGSPYLSLNGLYSININ